jgi:hypothetical protein
MGVDLEAIRVRHIATISSQNRRRKRRATPIVTPPITRRARTRARSTRERREHVPALPKRNDATWVVQSGCTGDAGGVSRAGHRQRGRSGVVAGGGEEGRPVGGGDIRGGVCERREELCRKTGDDLDGWSAVHRTRREDDLRREMKVSPRALQMNATDAPAHG